jgi:thiol:disulfide interchange protein DsbC
MLKLVQTFLVTLAVTASSAALAGQAEVTAAIKRLNPDAKAESIKPAPIAGWMEVSLGGQILYFTDDGKYLLQGNLVESTTRRNLTEESLAVTRRASLKGLNAKDMIVFPAKGGKAKHVLKVFTDIDCGYCRKLHSEISTYTDLGIEVQYLWFPRAGVPSDSSRKAVAVFCAKDQRKALTDAKNGVDPGTGTCVNPIEKDFNLGQRLGVNGTPALFLEDGTLMPGYMPAATLFAELEKHAAAKAN